MNKTPSSSKLVESSWSDINKELAAMIPLDLQDSVRYGRF